MKRLELAIESINLASRWLLVVFYIGLGLALAVYALSFGKKLYEFITTVFPLGDTDTILKMLGLIDAALVASLVVMVIISGMKTSSAASTTKMAAACTGWHDRCRLAQGQGRLDHRRHLLHEVAPFSPLYGEVRSILPKAGQSTTICRLKRRTPGAIAQGLCRRRMRGSADRP